MKLSVLLFVALILVGSVAGVAYAQADPLETAMTNIGTAITGLVSTIVPIVAAVLVAVLSLSAGRALAKRFLKA